MRRNRFSVGTVGLAVLWIVGCGGSIEPEVPGRVVETFVQDDPGTAFPAVGTSSPVGTFGRFEAAVVSEPGATTFSGSLRGEMQVSLSADGSSWVDLGPLTSTTVELQASGREVPVHGPRAAPFRSYRFLRLLVRDVEITLNPGSRIGNVQLTETRQLAVQANREVVVSREVPPFTIDPSSGARIFFEFNAENWITSTAVQIESVTAESIEPHVTVRVRSVVTGS